MSDEWWRLDMSPEEARQRAEAERAAVASLNRRWELIRSNRSRNLKLWSPQERDSGDWLATWTDGTTEGRSATFATEDDLLARLPAIIGRERNTPCSRRPSGNAEHSSEGSKRDQ